MPGDGHNHRSGTNISPKHSIVTVLHGKSVGKVPLLCVMVKKFSLSEANASVTLVDPTGEMKGTLHRGVFDEHSVEDLAPGVSH